MTQILVLGIAVLDDVYAIPAPLEPGVKHRASALRQVVGGTAANAALAITRLSGRANLLTRLGDDDAAHILRHLIEAEGIGLALSAACAGCATSRSAIIIEPSGDRTVINRLDPALPDMPDWLPDALPVGTGAVLADVRWESAARRLFTLARKAGIPAIFDGDRAPVDLTLLDLASHVAFSAQGLREFTRMDDLAAGLEKVAARHPGFFAVTDGANGVLAMIDGRVRHIPAFSVASIDTLGAGDVWHGAFALAVGEGMPMMAAIRFSNAAAAIKCTRPGGSAGAPGRDEVEAFLNTCATTEAGS